MTADPTANTAARNVDGGQRAAYVVFRNEDGHTDRIWFDPENFKLLVTMGRTFRDESGERHYRFKTDVAVAATTTAWTIEGDKAATP